MSDTDAVGGGGDGVATVDAAATSARTLTHGRLLARNVVYNVGGSVLPAVAALLAVPILIRAFGDARFGVLALAWTCLGYFSLFDLGIGRAVTHMVADHLGEGGARAREIGVVIRTSLTAILPVGVAAGVALYLIAPWLSKVLSLPETGGMRAEATAAFRILSVAVPFASITGALRGALEAGQRFGVVNALRIPLGMLTFLGPVATLPFTRSLIPAMVVLTVGRALLCVAHYLALTRAVPAFRTESRHWDHGIARRLLTVGGWMQVSHFVSPLMATLDRFVVGAVLGIGLVAYYVTPQELVTKMWLFNIGVLPVFFSAVSTTANRDAGRTTMLFDKLLRVTMVPIFIPTLVIVALAPDILRLWLGPAFATQSALVMQVMAIAVFVNCLGQGALSLVQAVGRSDLSAKYHLAELPFYLVMLWILLPRFGILGAATAWSVRTVVDTIVLMATCPVLLPMTRSAVTRIGAWLLAASSFLALSAMLSDSGLRFAVVLIGIPLWLGMCWRFVLTPEERALPLRMINAAWRPERA